MQNKLEVIFGNIIPEMTLALKYLENWKVLERCVLRQVVLK